MNPKRTQLAPALALVQLLQEYPTLPDATWHVDPTTGVLHGHLHQAGFADLAAYTVVLGGAVRPGRDYRSGDRMMRPHYLKAEWRDVTVSVCVVLPAPVVVERAA